MTSAAPQFRVRSSYTLGMGASPVAELVSRAAELGMPAMGLTDHHNLFGALEFCKYALAKGVQPVVGMRVRVVGLSGGRGGMTTLLARDGDGFSNLCAMLRAVAPPPAGSVERKTAGDGPRLPRDALRARAGGVMCLWGGGLDGAMSALRGDEGDSEADFLAGCFGDRLYAEVCRVPGEAPPACEAAQVALARRRGIPLLGTCDVWYAAPARHRAWVLLGAMSAEPRRELLVGDEGLLEGGPAAHGLPSGEEFKALFADLPEAAANAWSVARRSAFAARGRKPMLPPFPCEGGRTEPDELRAKARAGLAARLDRKGLPQGDRAAHEGRLEFEMGVIERMGFPGYFLIVADFIGWSKAQGIPVGPGRGSGAGSVVAWALGITDLDPLEFGLLFERFLNPDRVSMPDFDIDFCEDRRDEVIAYVRAKYGEDRVAYIATFGVIKGKTALRDTHRVVRHDRLGAVGLREIDRVSKLIPKKEDAAEPMGLEEAWEKVPEFREAVSPATAPAVAMVYDLAREVEGLMKSRGQHAAGVVIADRPLEDLIPIVTDERTGSAVTGYSLKGVEDAGLVKFDFLGLTTLSILEDARRHVMATHGFDLDLADLPRDDPQVMAGLAKGDATGVFQFETGGMRQVLRQVRVTALEDLIAVVALFRPGPMAYIDIYADRKHGRVPTEYPGPRERTEPFLAETHGIMVYQEQVMQVAQACAGYTLGEADLLRRAIGKKVKADMDRQRDRFVRGCAAGWLVVDMEDGSRWEVHSMLGLRVKDDPVRRMTAREMFEQGVEPDETDLRTSARRVG